MENEREFAKLNLIRNHLAGRHEDDLIHETTILDENDQPKDIVSCPKCEDEYHI